MKKIIVASDIPSNREQIINGVNGYLEQLDGQAFADRIQRLIQDPEENKKIVENLENEKIDFTGEIAKLENLLG